MQLRVLILACVPDRAEAESYCALQYRGSSVHIITDPRDKRVSLYEAAGMTVERFEVPYRFNIAAMRKLRSLMLGQPFDVVLAVTSKWLTAALMVFGKSQIPIVTYRGTLGNLSYLDPTTLLAHLHPRVNKIICVCHAVRRYLLSMKLPESKAVTIYKGHDPDWYTALPTVSRSDLGLDPLMATIACVANVRPLKGIDVLLKAVAKANQRIQVMIIGDCSDRSLMDLPEQLDIAGRVHFLGFRDDATPLMRLADCTVLPSVRREGLARVVLESMFQGIPVLVSDTGGLPELPEDGVSGYITPAGDVAALASALDRFFSLTREQRQAMGEAARIRAETRFSHAQTVDALIQVLEGCVLDPMGGRDSWLSRL